MKRDTLTKDAIIKRIEYVRDELWASETEYRIDEDSGEEATDLLIKRSYRLAVELTNLIVKIEDHEGPLN